MADWFIAPAGNDSNAGTSTGAPFLTLGKALSVVSAGEGIECATGSYNEQIERGDFVTVGTSSSNKVSISAASGATPIFKPTTSDTEDEVLRMSNAGGTVAAFVHFTGITFDGTNCRKGCCKITIDAGGVVAHHLTFTSCVFKNGGVSTTPPTDPDAAAGHGVLLSGETYNNLFDTCTFKDNGIVAALDHGLYLSGSPHDNTITGCTFDGNAAHGVQVFGGASYNNVFKKNVFKNSNSSAIIFTGGGSHDNELYNNVIWGAGNQGFGVEINYQVSLLVANNSITDHHSGIKVQSGNDGCTLRNNCLWENSTAGIVNEGTGTVASNNLDNDTNPTWTNASAGDLTISSGSAAEDAGFNLSSIITDDYAGDPRPSGSAFDIGAYEIQVAGGGGGGGSSGGGLVF